MMISMKAHLYDNTFLITLHAPWGWGLSACVLNWSFSMHTTSTANQGHLFQKMYIYLIPARVDACKSIHKDIGTTYTVWNEHKISKRNKCLCIDMCTTQRYRDKQSFYLMLEKCQGYVHEIEDWHFIPSFGILDYPDKDEMEKMLHCVDTAYQRGLNGIFLILLVSMHV